ncbi:MAG: hypothetical protein VXY23_07835 [Pseudomonadota bacterium]|nr:hypothetical protein [Pseudomonadota bacterium]
MIIDLELNEDDAWVFALFLKRLCFSDFKANACDEAEAYQMRDATGRVQEALARHGFSPR